MFDSLDDTSGQSNGTKIKKTIEYKIYNNKYYLLKGLYSSVIDFNKDHKLRLTTFKEAADFIITNFDYSDSPSYIKKPFFIEANVVCFEKSYFMIISEDIISRNKELIDYDKRIMAKNLQLLDLGYENFNIFDKEFKNNGIKIPFTKKQIKVPADNLEKINMTPEEKLDERIFNYFFGEDKLKYANLYRELGQDFIKIDLFNRGNPESSSAVVEKIQFNGLENMCKITSSYLALMDPVREYLAVKDEKAV
ncbi:TPA: hypothetical protein HA235_05550 [Candidatus Woesearchaeota archaeon]|nr:hypothetical protein [Candidatus Woesearchaeota archaeon]HIH32146.1 hypothetical protein [Candidatus Woesearchaeota archaeon]HIJ14659.1 hypothetical protein [Candidatus Woesearchaeota archaeon]